MGEVKIKHIEYAKHLFEEACHAYVILFCEKQGMEFFNWVNNESGTIALIGDYFIDLRDIRYDVDNMIPVGKILQWQDYVIDNHNDHKLLTSYENWLYIDSTTP